MIWDSTVCNANLKQSALLKHFSKHSHTHATTCLDEFKLNRAGQDKKLRYLRYQYHVLASV